jgi:hypothetical protein
MAFALNPAFNQNLRSLISVDMSPAVGRISPELVHILMLLFMNLRDDS